MGDVLRLRIADGSLIQEFHAKVRSEVEVPTHNVVEDEDERFQAVIMREDRVTIGGEEMA